MPGIKFSCTACGARLEAPAEAAGCPVECPICNKETRVPTPSEPAAVATEVPVEAAMPAPKMEASPSGDFCAICQTVIKADEPQNVCSTCQAKYHADCWTENGGCAVYGCSEVPAVEQRRSIEIPISYWGQENKPCPACGQEILAAAVRCRFCGAKFASARPEDAGAFQERAELTESLPALKRMIVIIFVLSVVPCCAPIGAIWGLIWFPLNRKRVRALPSVFPALCYIGLFVSIGQCLLILLMTLFYSVFHGE